MKPRYQVSKRAIELIKRFEGFRQSAAALGDGRYTIGYGHTRTARAGVSIDERDAEALLIYDLLDITATVNNHVYTPLTQNQFDALCCFAFNVGAENFRHSSVLRRINEGNLIQAAAALEIWRKSDFEGERIVVDALIRRRAAEKALFLTPADGWVPSPSPILPPKMDYDVVAAASKDPAVRLVAPLTGPEATVRAEPGARETAPALDTESPVTAAADAVTARLQALAAEPPPEPEPETEPAPVQEAAEPLAEALEPAPVVEQAAPVEAEEPAVEPVADPVAAPVVERALEHPSFELTPSEPESELQYAEFHPVAEEADPGVQSAPLPFDAPAPDPVPVQPVQPVTARLAPVPASTERFGRREPTAYFDGEFPRFGEPVEPMRFHLLPLILLFITGLVATGFAVVWGLSTSGAGGGPLGPMAISWLAGLFGIACIIGAFYMFATRLGGPDE